MPIEMPPFSKIYKERDGVDKFFYDKFVEVVNAVNALTAGETSTASFTVTDDNGDGVEGAKVTITSGNNSYSTGDTGKAGGASIQNVEYGVYDVSLELPVGYNALATYDKVTINKDTVKVNLIVNKKQVVTATGEAMVEEEGEF